MATRSSKSTTKASKPTASKPASATTAKPVFLAVNPDKPYAVKAKHNQQSWEQLQAAIASGLTLAQMGASNSPIGNKRFARYCLRRGWVITTAKAAKASK
jgi:pyrroline-5-carboxylate reductase